MLFWIKLWIGRKLGKTGYEMITSPMAKMAKGLSKLGKKRQEDAIILDMLQKQASQESAMAFATAAKLANLLEG